MTFREQIIQYSDIITKKHERGLISNNKAQRLYDKIDEWVAVNASSFPNQMIFSNTEQPSIV